MSETLNGQDQQMDIFVELGMGDASEADKSVIIQSLQELLQERIMLRLNEILTEDQKSALSKFSEENKENQLSILKFIMDMVPNYEDMSKEEALKIREELIEEYNASKK